MPKHWENFVLALLLHLCLPLLPLILEGWFSGKIETKSAALTAALYSMAIGLSSRSTAIFGAGVITCIVFSAAFGFLSQQPLLAGADALSYAAIAFVFLVHMIERYNRHVVDKTPFFEFQ